MIKLIIYCYCIIAVLSCNSQNNTNRYNVAEDSAVEANSYLELSEIADNEGKETLNDIRFAGWTSKEWADNDYIRAVRKFIDAYNNGEIEYPYLDKHK